MKRDMDLVCDLMLKIEDDPIYDGMNWVPADVARFGVNNHTKEEIGYHLRLLIEAGLIKGKTIGEPMRVINKLTWEGHEFLINIRDQGIWNKAKAQFKDLPGVSIALLAEIAEAEIRKYLGLL
jgi:hypothetical protein